VTAVPAQIRPNRLEVTDRFPMLGFTIRTDGTPQRAEVAIAASPDLFRVEHKADRAPSNFYSSRAAGPLRVPRGEAVYVVPPEVLAQFVGQERLYFAVATAPEGNGPLQVAAMPAEGSPYVQLRGLTGRSLRRVRVAPSRHGGYGTNGKVSLDWAGDAAVPGAVPANGNGGQATAQPPAADYDDGFGPMPAPSTAPAANGNGGAANATESVPPQAAAAAYGRAPAPLARARSRALDLASLSIAGERTPVTAPSVTRLPDWQATLAQGALMALSGPLAPALIALPAAARAAGVSIGIGPAVSAGLGGGAGLGVGIVFGPDGGVGVYGAAEFQVGFIASVSAVAQVTVVRGGIESFNGWGMSAAISGGEGIVGGAAALFDMQGNFQGVSLQLGVGVGLTPVDFYVAIQRQVAVQLAVAQGRMPARTRAFDLASLSIAGERTPVTAPSVTRLPDWQATLAQGALMALSGPLAPALIALPAAARAAGVSIGIGPAVSAGLGGGAGLGVGIVFGPDGGVGVYGAAEFQVGFIASISAVAQVTVVRGGIESFNGWGMSAAISGGEGIVGGAAALFDMQGNFQGVSLQLGVGVGLTPVDFYVAIQRQVAVQLAVAQAHARARARGLEDYAGAGMDEDSLHGIEEPIPDEDGASGAVAQGWSRGLELTPEDPYSSRFAPAGSTNYRRSAGPRTISRVVIHITDGGSRTQGTVDWFQSTNQRNRRGELIRVSAHYVIGRDGEVVQMVAHNDVAWHAGPANGDSIGIEHCANTRGLDPTEEQYAASAQLVRWLCQTYSIPVDRVHVLGHREADPRTSHVCPSDRWLWDHYMELVNAGATTGSVAQSLSRRARPLGAESFTLNWDEVEAVPQPTDVTCWAAAAAMVVGWRDRMSLPPEAIAAIAQRTTASGLDPAQVGAFASEIGLVAEPPQSYTVDGFRQLLERNGPLWVGASLPGLHVIVVTGLYSDGSATFVRVTDPWDRQVGTPGAPGDYLDTHATGSRYILSWEAFVREYEAAATDYSRVNLQVLHSGGAAGRTPNYGSATGAGYAQSLGGQRATRAARASSRSLSAESFTLNWDEVEAIPQPTNSSCWAAAAAMVVGWRDRVSLSPQSIGEICGRTTATGLDPAQVGQFATEIGLVPEPPQSYSVDGFRRLLENHGPLWVASAVPGLHAIVVTGLYGEGDSAFVRITDPWDRQVGKPGSPGAYLPTHDTGSRYIMSWDDFVREYEAAATDFRTVNLQILHADSAAGRTPNYGSAASAGYAQALRRKRPSHSRAYAEDAAGTAPAGRRQDVGGSGTVRWTLDQYDGLRGPAGVAPGDAAGALERVVRLDDWPLVHLPEGDVQLPLTVSWRHVGGAVGAVTVRPGEPRVVPGWTITATAVISEGPDAASTAALSILVRQVFGRAGQPDAVALTRLALFGDGTYQRQDQWEHAEAGAA
jgi:N-acetyl-anhydromuramyl-L-alanine amidase AmpD